MLSLYNSYVLKIWSPYINSARSPISTSIPAFTANMLHIIQKKSAPDLYNLYAYTVKVITNIGICTLWVGTYGRHSNLSAIYVGY